MALLYFSAQRPNLCVARNEKASDRMSEEENKSIPLGIKVKSAKT